MKDLTDYLFSIFTDIILFISVLIPISAITIKFFSKIASVFTDDAFVFWYTPLCFITGVLACMYSVIFGLKFKE